MLNPRTNNLNPDVIVCMADVHILPLGSAGMHSVTAKLSVPFSAGLCVATSLLLLCAQQAESIKS